MDNLIESPLKESAVNGDNRLQALEREPRSEGDGVLLAHADIEATIREFLLVVDQGRSLEHGRRDWRRSSRPSG